MTFFSLWWWEKFRATSALVENPATGWTHLTVDMVLTMGSWIGYHTSANRPKYAIKFVNYPFIQFVLDVSMVIAYWLTAATTPLPSSSGLAPTAGATSESLLVAISFILYILWDRVSKIMQERPNYPSLQPKPYDHGRRVITVFFALGSVGVVALAWWVQEGWGDPRTWVIGIDCALVALLCSLQGSERSCGSFGRKPAIIVLTAKR